MKCFTSFTADHTGRINSEAVIGGELESVGEMLRGLGCLSVLALSGMQGSVLSLKLQVPSASP